MFFIINFSKRKSILNVNKMSLIRRFKFFKKTTKFKKYVVGASKSTIVRRRYTRRKRWSSNIFTQQIASYWSFNYSRQRRIENFLFYFYAFKYTIPLPSVIYFYKRVLHKNFKEIYIGNVILVPRKTIFNKSLFRKKNPLFSIDIKYLDGSYLVFNSIKNYKIISRLLLSHVTMWGGVYHPRLLLIYFRYKKYLVLIAGTVRATFLLLLSYILKFLLCFRKIFIKSLLLLI